MTRLKSILADVDAYVHLLFRSEDSDDEVIHIVRPLTALSLLSIVLSVMYSALWAITLPDQSHQVVFTLLFSVPSAITLILIRMQRVRLASVVFLSGLWLVTTMNVINAGGTLAPGFELYTLNVMIAAFLVGWRMALTYATATVLVGYALAIADPDGTQLTIIATPLTAWLTHAVVMIFVMGATYFIILRNQQALAQARQALAERDKFEKSLLESEERFRLIASVTSDYTFSSQLDKDGNLAHLLLTGAFETITGYTPEEFRANGGWRATVHPDDVEQDTRDIAMLRNRQPIVSEIRVIRKDGEIRWVRVYAHPIWEEKENRLVGINGAVQDITERKQAEEAVKRSEAHLRALLDATTDVAFLMSLDGTLLTLNETLARPMGKTAAQMIGTKAFDMLNDDLRALRSSQFERVIESGQPVRWEDGASGYWWDNSVYPVLSETGEVEAFAIYSRNITPQKRLEAELRDHTIHLEKLVDERTNALRRANEQLELIINSTNNALAFAQPNGDIIMANQAFTAMFDAKAKKSIEVILKSLRDDRQAEIVCNALLRVIHHNEKHQLEAQISSDANTEIDIDLTLIPVQGVDDDPRSGILLSGHDITQIKDIERLKSRFIADAVHDLATPISGLSTRLYLLQRSPDKMMDHIKSLENQLQHLRNLLEDLRTFSQMDRGQLILNRQRCNLNDLVQRVFDTYEPVAMDKNQTLSLRMDSELPEIALDQRQIERVLVNLVSNAINYTPHGKDIRIETGIDTDSVFLRVIDEGIGIGEQDIHHIFDRFYRTDEARRNRSSGTGLGLAITREIIEMHGGSVSVTSIPGEGSCFSVRLGV